MWFFSLANLPPPVSKEQLGARILAQERYEQIQVKADYRVAYPYQKPLLRDVIYLFILFVYTWNDFMFHTICNFAQYTLDLPQIDRGPSNLLGYFTHSALPHTQQTFI